MCMGGGVKFNVSPNTGVAGVWISNLHVCVYVYRGGGERDNVVYWKTNGKINNDLQLEKRTQETLEKRTHGGVLTEVSKGHRQRLRLKRNSLCLLQGCPPSGLRIPALMKSHKHTNRSECKWGSTEVRALGVRR